MTEPHLHVSRPTGAATGIALVLHGGQSRSHRRVRAGQLAVLRMLPFARALERQGGPDGLVVARLRYRLRGWNGAEQSPVADASWALDRLAERYPGRPVALVGHSMGGRTALYVAGHSSVRAVVGLAPWIEAGDPHAQLAGRRLLIAHGSQDRMTSPPMSAEYARSVAGIAESVSYVEVAGERHAMLRRAAVWNALAVGFVTGVIYNRLPTETGGPEITNILTKALAGQPSLVV
jgi:pimeloyl-ACP methyl ester carboxylesterase